MEINVTLVEGSLVIVLGKLDQRIREKNPDGLVIGTFLGFLSDKRVVVLLDNGEFFIGAEYEVIPNKEQL